MYRFILIFLFSVICLKADDLKSIENFSENLKKPLFETTAPELIKQNPNINSMIISDGLLMIDYNIDARTQMRIVYYVLGPALTGYPVSVSIGSYKEIGSIFTDNEVKAWIKLFCPGIKFTDFSSSYFESSNIAYTIRSEKQKKTVESGKTIEGYSSLSIRYSPKKELLEKYPKEMAIRDLTDFLKNFKPIYPELKPISKSKVTEKVNTDLSKISITRDGIFLDDKKVEVNSIKDGSYRIKWDRSLDYRRFCQLTPAFLRVNMSHNGRFFISKADRKKKIDLAKGIEVMLYRSDYSIQNKNNRQFISDAKETAKAIQQISAETGINEFHLTYYFKEKLNIQTLEEVIIRIPAGMSFSIHTSNELPGTRKGINEYIPNPLDEIAERAKEQRESAALIANKLLESRNHQENCWGNKNKMLCTAYSLVTGLDYKVRGLDREKDYVIGKTFEYLLNNINKASYEELNLLLISLAWSYKDYGDEAFDKLIKNLMPQLEKNWLPLNKFKTDMRRYYLQVMTAKIVKDSGCSYDFAKFDKEISLIKPGSNVILLASCLLWGRKVSVPQALTDKLLKVLKSSQSFIDDLIIKDVLFNSGSQNKAQDIMKEKFKKLSTDEFKYKFDKKFSKEENEYLMKIIPSLVNGLYFPIPKIEVEDPVEEPKEVEQPFIEDPVEQP